MTKEKTKSKPKHAPSRFSWRKILKVMFISIALFVLFMITLVLWELFMPKAIITQTSLPDDLRPLAEELLLTTLINEDINIINEISLRLEVTPQGMTTNEAGYHTICFYFLPLGSASYQRVSDIFVNGEKVKGLTHLIISVLTGYEGRGEPHARCAEGDLDTGLHLIEFHLRDSAWGEPVAIQRWAIEIE